MRKEIEDLLSEYDMADSAFAKDLRKALAEQPAQQEPVGPEPFGYFQYDIRLDAWVQNRINNKGVAFYIKEQK